tara:strand:+ start:139 stop:1260 length:1122 start_codon:yes stop_codon:yes gene_type:complete
MKKKHNILITQNGGECLGAGTFGCVLKPYISCSDSNKSNIGVNSTNPNIISKISTYDSYDSDNLNDIYDEIQIGSKVYKLDKKCEYLCPIIKYCKIDVENVKFRDDIELKHLKNMEDIDLEYETKSHEKKCLFNINERYLTINLISHYAGPDLNIFFSNKSSKFKKYHTLIKNEFNTITKDLLTGLYILHKNQITHKDIKLNNICIIIKNNRPLIKYIDFGLSEDLKELTPSFNNIYNSGTPSYMPPDFIILVEMKRLKFNNLMNKRSIHINIINKLFNSIKSNMSTFTNKGLNQTYLKGNLDTIHSSYYLDSIKHNNYFISKKDVSNIFIFFLNLYKNEELLKFYFKPVIGINPKFDIFSLGLVLFELKKKN